MVAFEEYSAERHYNTLQDLSEAHDEFAARNVQNTVDSQIARLFVEHGVQSQLGLTLLHKHFPVHSGEKIVNYGAVACPWDTNTMTPEVSRDIRPSSWRFTERTALAPYEFEYIMAPSHENILQEEELQAFLGKLGIFLDQENLIHLLGVQVLDTVEGEPGLEFTADRANITLPLKVSGPDGDDGVDALWVFGEELGGDEGEKTVYKKCKKKCVKKKTGHRKVHTGTDRLQE
jgi:hypothetical protein